MNRSITVAFLLLPLSLSFSQAPTSGLRNRLQAKLDSIHSAGKFPGVTAAVSFAGGETIGVASGVSDRTKNVRMTNDAILMQGSVGKTYVAAVALQLIGEGKIALDEKVSRYLGRNAWYSRVPNADNITVRMLMNHTSGVMRYEFKDAFTRDLTADPDKRWRPDELVAYVLDDTASFEAGKGWEYSDTNYILLGMIIESVTGRAYFDLLRERILSRFGLSHTVPVEGRKVSGLVQGYAGPNNPFGGTDAMIADGMFAINPQFEWTGGGIASTSTDLARWGALLYGGSVVDGTLLQKALEGVPARLGPNARYGLGVIIRESALGPLYGHSGFFPGYMTELIYLPGQRCAIAVQVNTSEFRTLGMPLIRFALELGRIVLEEMQSGKG